MRRINAHQNFTDPHGEVQGVCFWADLVEEPSSQEKATLFVEIRPRKKSRPGCSVYERKRPHHDTRRTAREFDYLLLWIYRMVFCYAAREGVFREAPVRVQRHVEPCLKAIAKKPLRF